MNAEQAIEWARRLPTPEPGIVAMVRAEEHRPPPDPGPRIWPQVVTPIALLALIIPAGFAYNAHVGAERAHAQQVARETARIDRLNHQIDETSAAIARDLAEGQAKIDRQLKAEANPPPVCCYWHP